ncbi:MAG: hypothetical protein M1335_02185 [Chloroflexi bacterium]|nr:hypothetical protein [Chloroflexota bacterium]
MEFGMNQAKLLLEAVQKFPNLPHNLLSTATDEDRRAAIAAILRWWNGEVVPILTEIEHGRE